MLNGISSCSNVGIEKDPTKSYKLDLRVVTKDIDDYGMVVLPKRDNYNIKFESYAKIDLFMFQSCSREIVLEKVRNGLSRKEVVVSYTPNELEKIAACSIAISALNEDRHHSYAYIEFEDDDSTLPAVVLCGDSSKVYNGVSVCQSREGLFQKIKFAEKVQMNTDEGCKAYTTDGKEYTIDVKLDYCLYVFKNEQDKYHRLTTYGYNAISTQEF
jgi:hypothetical protein